MTHRKKTLVIAIGAVALIGGGLLAWYLTRKAGQPPAVSTALEAESTVGFFGVEDLAGLIAELDGVFNALPAELKEKLPSGFGLKSRNEKLGFDPATEAGWASVGVDSASGLTVVLDARLHRHGEPWPILLARLTNRDKLFDRLGELGVPVERGKSEGGIEEISVDGARFFLGQRGEYTALTRKKPRIKDGFAAFLKGGGETLDGTEQLDTAFGDSVGPPRLIGYGDARGLEKLLGDATGEPKVAETVAFYRELFPAAALYAGLEGGGWRLVANGAGVAILRKLFVPSVDAPKFARYLPRRGWAAFRGTVNMKELFNGLGELVPPTAPPQAQAGLSMVPAALAMQTGVDWNRLVAAFPGHAAVALSLEALLNDGLGHPERLDWLALATVGDRAAADELLARLAELVKAELHGVEGGTFELGGVKGVFFELYGAGIYAVRHEDTLLVGPSKRAIQAAIDRSEGKNLTASAAGRALDGEAVYVFYADASPVVDWLQQGAGLSDSEGEILKAVASHPRLAKLREDPLLIRLVVDGDGLVATATGGGGGLMTFIGPAAAITVPAFLKFTRRSKSVEATMNVRTIFDGAVAYYNDEHVDQTGLILPRAFPPSVAETPGNPTEYMCRDGEPVELQSDARTWNNPTWRALGFAVIGPQRYAYTFESAGTGADASFTIRARGDLDCDGVLSTYERTGRIDADNKVSGAAGVFIENELE